MEISDVVLTHAGRFHADDVFSAALLRMLKPGVQVRRVLEVPEDFTGLAFDVGRGAFDHHQPGAEVRGNGVPYAAFGLLWREFGSRLVEDDHERQHFDWKFIQPLDLDDNTGCGSPIAEAVADFNPLWDSEESPDRCFEEAVEFAALLLRKKLEAVWGIQRARRVVEARLKESEDGIVVLDRFAPWKMTLAPSSAEFVVYPSQRGGYNAQGVPTNDESSRLKCPFPAAWAGLEGAELREASGLEGLRFCHKNQFLISAGTLEDALEACRAARAARR